MRVCCTVSQNVSKDTHFIEHANSSSASCASLSFSHPTPLCCGACLLQAPEHSAPTSSHPSVHWTLPNGLCPITHEERVEYITQEGEENSVWWAICPMSCNTWLSPGEEQTSAEGSSSGLLTVWFPCNDLFQARPGIGWVKASLRFSCVRCTLHGSSASWACAQESVVWWLPKCWEILPEHWPVCGKQAALSSSDSVVLFIVMCPWNSTAWNSCCWTASQDPGSQDSQPFCLPTYSGWLWVTSVLWHFTLSILIKRESLKHCHVSQQCSCS